MRVQGLGLRAAGWGRRFRARDHGLGFRLPEVPERFPFPQKGCLFWEIWRVQSLVEGLPKGLYQAFQLRVVESGVLERLHIN